MPSFSLVAIVAQLVFISSSFADAPTVIKKLEKTEKAEKISGESPDGIRAYSKDQFATLLKSGEKIVLEFHASWCPICKKQRNALTELAGSSDFKRIHFIAADYDSEKELKEKYKVKRQATLVLLPAAPGTDPGKEPQSVGVTDKDQLKSFIQQLVSK